MKPAAIALAISALLAGTAHAAGGTASFSAVITEAFEDSPPIGSIPAGYDDPNFGVGDVISFDATLSDVFILPGTPYYGARAKISQLSAIADLFDREAFFKLWLSTGYAGEVVEYPSPIIVFTADRVVGVAGIFLDSRGNQPGYEFPSWLSGRVACSRPVAEADYECANNETGGTFFDLKLGTTGGIIGGYYANEYPNRYTLEFDWAHSTVTADLTDIGFVAAPEPATWGLMIVGFAGVGTALRRRLTPRPGAIG